MKSIVLYSTRTGNTKMVAEAIASALPEGTPCRNIREMNESLSDYDCVFMGFWVDKGTADDASRKVLENLHNRHVAVFATVGVNPASSHAQDCLKNGASLLPEGKKPFVLSLDDLSYYHSYDGRGIASKLVLDENGKPTCEYIQADGSFHASGCSRP